MIEKIVENARNIKPEQMEAPDCALSLFNSWTGINLMGKGASQITPAKNEILKIAARCYHDYMARPDDYAAGIFMEMARQLDPDFGKGIYANL